MQKSIKFHLPLTMKFDDCVDATAWSNIKVKLMKINQGVEKNFIVVVHLCAVKKDGFMLYRNLTIGKVVNPAQAIFAPFVFGGLVVDQSRQMPILETLAKKIILGKKWANSKKSTIFVQ